MICPCCAGNECQTIESINTIDVAAAYGRDSSRTEALILDHVNAGTMPSSFEMMRCASCQLEFANPMFAADAEWYALQEKYGERWEFYEVLRRWSGRQLDVLEIGCGEGHFLQMAQSAGHRVRGYDFNANAVSVARAKGVDARVADLRDLETAAPPEAIVLFHVIEHLETPSAFFSELAARTKPGTRVYFSCPSPRRYTTDLLPGQKLGRSDYFDYPPLHQTRWCRTAASALLERTGWHFETYDDEPFDRIGIPGSVAARKVEMRGGNFASIDRTVRRIKIMYEVARLFPASFRFSGMSMLVEGRRKA